MPVRPYVYYTVVLRVGENASFSRVLSVLRGRRGVEVLDYDEALRRIVARVPPSEIVFVREVARGSAASCFFEVKAGLRLGSGRALEALRGAGFRVARVDGRILAYGPCRGGYGLFVEVRGGRGLVKLCRWSSSVDPTGVPGSLCSFDMFSEDPVGLGEELKKCIQGVLGG